MEAVFQRARQTGHFSRKPMKIMAIDYLDPRYHRNIR
jgi:hypothetical protein